MFLVVMLLGTFILTQLFVLCFAVFPPAMSVTVLRIPGSDGRMRWSSPAGKDGAAILFSWA